MMRAEQFAHMKDGAVFINAARGTCVEIDALAEVLTNGKLRGAAVDVFPVEPKSNGEPLESPLVGLKNVILTPHIGGSTQEAQANIGLEVAEKLVRYSDAGDTVTSVNFPEVSIPLRDGAHRILHVHKNVPGVLAQINSSFADAGINITSQSLMTDGDLGYLVMDVDDDDSDAAVGKLRAVEQTLKVRVLY